MCPYRQNNECNRGCRWMQCRHLKEKRHQASALHEYVLLLGLIPGCENHANTVSKEAAISDSEVAALMKRQR